MLLYAYLTPLLSDTPSFWQQISDYIYENYLNVTLGGYEHLDFSASASTLTAIIFGLMAGIILASAFIVWQKNSAGRPIRFLLGMEADSPASALPLSKIPVKEKKLLRLFRRNLAVRKTVCAVLLSESSSAPLADSTKSSGRFVENTNNSGTLADCMAFPILYHLPKNADLTKYAFYIPPALEDRAYFRFKKDGNGVRWVIVSAVVFFVLGVLLVRFLPQFLRLLDNLVGLIMG